MATMLLLRFKKEREREQNVTHPFAPQINDITLMKKVFISSYA